MKKFLRSMSSNVGVVGELLGFLGANKRWWLIPMVAVLLLFGLLVIFGSASGLAPFYLHAVLGFAFPYNN